MQKVCLPSDKTSPISLIEKGIYLGAAAHAVYESEEFLEHKFDLIINCCAELCYQSKSNIHIVKFRSLEGDAISFMETMDDIADLLDEQYDNGQKVYIHCDKGLSRSPSFIIYWLMRKKIIHYFDAYDIVQKARPNIAIDQDFIDVMMSICDL